MYCAFESKPDFTILFCKPAWLHRLDLKSSSNFSVFIYFPIKMRCIITLVEIKHAKELSSNADYLVFYCDVLFIFLKTKIFNVNNLVT